MTTLREVLRRLAGRPAEDPAQAADFSYMIYWTTRARTWDRGLRRGLADAVRSVVSRPEFEGNLYARKYRVSGLDNQAHAGASLRALLRVLQALEEREEQA